MKKIKNTTLLILALFSFAVAYSQPKAIIRGRVIDKNDKSAIVGANIVEYDKDNRVINGTVCNVNGDFVLEMKSMTNTVKVSYIGYTTQEIKVDPTKTMSIELESSSHVMDEVVVTAQSKRYSLTNLDDRDKASSSVRMDLRDMKESGALSIADALQGRVSGLDIVSAGGNPGSGANITIRGLSSMGNSKPLIVVDGIPQATVPNDFNLGSANAEDIGTLINISVQDIKSVEVLKDAASTAAYGSKGADGVLLIETHKGKKGNVKIDYTYKASFNFQPPSIPMLNGDEYIMLQREEWHNSKGIYPIPPEIAYDRSYSDFYNYSQNTDWIGAITQNALTNDHYLSVSGGGEKATYFTSVSYVDEGGTTLKTGSKTFSTRVNLDYLLSKKMTFNINFSYTHNLVNDNMSVGNKNIREMAYIKAPNMSIWEYDAYGNPTGEYLSRPNSYQGAGDSYYNPVAVANLGKNDKLKNSLMNSFSVTYHFTKWLTFMETASIEIQGEKDNTFLPYNAIGSDWYAYTVNKGDEINRINQDFKTHSQLIYNFNIQKHQISGGLTWQTEQQRYEDMTIQGNLTPTVDIQDPAVNAQINWNGSNLSETRFLEGVLSANYKYADKYGLQLILTEDAHTSFGANHRWGLFNGISGFWRFSDEPLMKELSFLGESKLRASWGISGKQPGDNYVRFASYADPGVLGYFQNKYYTISENIPRSYIGSLAVVPTQIQLNNLQWSKTSSTDFGLDLNMFKDRLNATVEVYNKVTTNILFESYRIPVSSGYEILKDLNGGRLENKGWELMLDYKFIQRKDLTCSINFNISQNNNAFTKFPDNYNKEASTSIDNGQYPQLLVEGEPIGSFYGFKYLGVYSSDKDAIAKDVSGQTILDNNGDPIPMTFKGTYVFKGGDAKYADLNHDGKIDLNDVTYIGNSNPKFFGGFGPSVRYKGFSFSCAFQFRTGFDIINNTALQTQGMNDKNNQSKAVLRRWRAQGQNEPGLLPRAYLDNPANNLGSDRYVEKGDFLRLLNVMAGYRVSQKVCDKLRLRSLSMTVSARKIATFTNYSGQDPEISPDASNPFWIGVDKSKTPPPRIITFAITVGL